MKLIDGGSKAKDAYNSVKPVVGTLKEKGKVDSCNKRGEPEADTGCVFDWFH